MINYLYQLSMPGFITVKYDDVSFSEKVIVRPLYMALCHADQRYYHGERSTEVLKKKLPMALIHECSGEVVYDVTGAYKSGQKVVLIPNVPPKNKLEGIYENYAEGSGFLSSGMDGFMSELVDLPADRLVPFENASPKVAAITEFLSCAIHALERLKKNSHKTHEKIGIWGDGRLSYTLALAISKIMPESQIFIIGKTNFKLSQFTFAAGTYLGYEIPENFRVDHAFDCAGGPGSELAIDSIIKHIRPQGTAVLMGVSENKIAVNTRDILEKGLTIIGSSRSGRADFEKAVELIENKSFESRLEKIIHEDEKVSSIADIHRVFKTDRSTSLKTVFRWDL